MSHGVEEVLQLRPIAYWLGHDCGTKDVDDDSAGKYPVSKLVVGWFVEEVEIKPWKE
jgi:hypothetical protein